MQAVSMLLLLLLAGSTTEASHVDALTLYSAGRCEDFSQAPLACQSTLRGSWASVWTAPSLGLTQEVWEAQMYGPVLSTPTQYVAYLDVISSLPYKNCAEAYAQLICPTFFPPCVPNPDPSTKAVIQVLPVPVCRSVCLAVNNACRDHQEGLDLLDCYNTTNPLTGALQWPDDNTSSCTHAPILNAEVERSVLLEYACPPPLVFQPDIPDQFSALGCSSTCMDKLFIVTSQHNYHSLYYVNTVLSWISFVLVCVLMVTIAIFKPLRQYPTRIVFYICIGLFVGYLGPIGASFTGFGYSCKDETQLAEGVSYCGFYAWTVYFGGLVEYFGGAFKPS